MSSLPTSPCGQSVLTVPFELRLLLAAKPEALSAVGRIFVQEIQRWQREQARGLVYERPETAAVSFCQRFGSSLNLNIHWHVILPDAVFLPDAAGEQVDTLKHRAGRLTRIELATGSNARRRVEVGARRESAAVESVADCPRWVFDPLSLT